MNTKVATLVILIINLYFQLTQVCNQTRCINCMIYIFKSYSFFKAMAKVAEQTDDGTVIIIKF